MESEVHMRRVNAFRARLEGLRPDTAWIVQQDNRRYLSGFEAADGQLNESSGSLLIGASVLVLVTDFRYGEEARQEAPGYAVEILPKGVVEGLPGIVEALGARDLGFEADYLPWGLKRKLEEKLAACTPAVRMSPLEGVVERMRYVKDEAEIAALEASADMISAILDRVLGRLEQGVSEREVAWSIESSAHEAGAEGLAFPSIVASGPNSALPHAVPTDRRLGPGEPVTLDVGVRLDGYCSDITRTVFLGEPDPEFKAVYRTVRRAQLAALDEIRPGVSSDVPDSVARRIITDAGYGDCFGHALGHGVGLATHEGPRLSPHKPTTLEQGMVVTVEPGIYLPGRGGVRLEETVLIEADGPRILTKSGFFHDFGSG